MALNVSRDVAVATGKTVTAASGSTTRLLGAVTLVNEDWPSTAGTTGQILYVASGGALGWKSEAAAATTFTPATVSDDYTVEASVDVVLVTAAPVTVTLPAVAAAGNKFITVADSGGNATAANPITIAAADGEFILGASSFPITSAYNTVKLFNNGDTRWLLG